MKNGSQAGHQEEDSESNFTLSNDWNSLVFQCSINFLLFTDKAQLKEYITQQKSFLEFIRWNFDTP